MLIDFLILNYPAFLGYTPLRHSVLFFKCAAGFDLIIFYLGFLLQCFEIVPIEVFFSPPFHSICARF